MSVVGFDFGNLQSCIAVARNRGIDIICNEVSNRFTPALVSFGPKNRHLGEAAATLQVSNLNNTVCSLKRLIGRPITDSTLDLESKYLSIPLLASPSTSSTTNEVGTKVTYLGQEKIYSATQLAAMYLGKLKSITEQELNAPVSDVVVSVPVWFAPSQRQAMIEACQIAGLNPLRIINDTTATALAYGITKTDLPEDVPRKVVFVDIGHSSTSIAAVEFVKGKLQIKATAADAFLGGRDLDQLLVDHFVKEFQSKYKFDVSQYPKPLFRLRAAIERVKKVLSANAQAPLNIEALLEDRDVSSLITREDFESYAAPFIARIAPMLQNVLTDAKWDKQDVFVVEPVGGTTRVPAVRDAITNFFGRDLLSYTVNQDEAVARGCALMCAIISPAFRVREFDIKDVNTYNATVSWMQQDLQGADEHKTLTVFEKGSVVPATKVLTFYRKPEHPFEFESNIDTNTTPLVADVPSFIGRYTMSKVPVGSAESPNEMTTVKVRVRMNPDHMVHVESAYALVEDTTPPQVPTPETPDVSSTSSPVPQPDDSSITKKRYKKVEVQVLPTVPHMPSKLLNDLKGAEASMAQVDKLVFDTENAKNSLEESIYECREKKEGKWAEFISDADKATLCTLLDAHEEWLYSEEGEDAQKAVYEQKHSELKAISSPAEEKCREAEDRPVAQTMLFDMLNKYLAMCENPEYSWLPSTELQGLKEKLSAKKEWASNLIKQQLAQPKYAGLMCTSAQLRREKEEVERMSVVLFNRLKPKPKVEADQSMMDVQKPDEGSQPTEKENVVAESADAQQDEPMVVD